MDDLLRLLSGAGDVGIWVMVAIWWRFEKRLITLELWKQWQEKQG